MVALLHLQKGHTNDPWYNGPGSAHLVFEIPLRRLSLRPRLRTTYKSSWDSFWDKDTENLNKILDSEKGNWECQVFTLTGKNSGQIYPLHPNVQPISWVSTRWFLESTRPHANVLKWTYHRAHKLFSWCFQIITLLHSGITLLKRFLCSFIPVLP